MSEPNYLLLTDGYCPKWAQMFVDYTAVIKTILIFYVLYILKHISLRWCYAVDKVFWISRFIGNLDRFWLYMSLLDFSFYHPSCKIVQMPIKVTAHFSYISLK